MDGTNVAVCWQGTATCGTTSNQFGWYANLPGAPEQIIFNPVFFQGAFIVNSTIPANNVATSCTSNLDTGYHLRDRCREWRSFHQYVPHVHEERDRDHRCARGWRQDECDRQRHVVTTSQGTANIVYQTISGTPGAQQLNIPSNTKAKRLTWIEHR